MNLSPRWQTTLADAGIETVHWSNVEDPRAPDSLLASQALWNALVVLTKDLDLQKTMTGAVWAGGG